MLGRKKYLRLVFIIVAVFLFCSFWPSAVSAAKYQEYAERLARINVFRGTGDGFDLEREPTRLEGLVMLVRLLGAEEEAGQITKYTFPFDDVPKWGRGYVQYAYENGLAKGISKTKFGSNSLIDAKSYITFLLRALGYSDQHGDFSWNEAIEFAFEKGIISESMYFELSSQPFLRDQMAKTSFDALNAFVKDTETRLLDYLVQKGSIDPIKAQAVFAGGIRKGSAELDFEKLIQACVYLEVETSSGEKSGSGFYIDQHGTIVTNYHVIEKAQKIRIINGNGVIYTGDVMIKGYDKELDIAILSTAVKNEAFLPLGDTSSIKVGQPVYAIGSPLGLSNTVSEGIISAIRANGIQTTAPISPGSSGGALINQNGEVIGITYAKMQGGENLGFAIPIEKIFEVNTDLNLTVAEFLARETPDLLKFKERLTRQYQMITLNGQQIRIDDIYISAGDSGIVYIEFIFEHDLDAYLNAELLGRDGLLDDFSQMAYAFSKELNANVFLQLSLMTEMSQYPYAFAENDILAELNMRPIKYIGNNTWLVYFPFVYVYVNTYNNVYYYGFWFN
ncbi:MAG: trypsin-like serine protease [Firmicutes bacterium]|nr:trypsin-like serine protease [Bacillota bacterium]